MARTFRTVRNKLGLSQSALADSLGVSIRAVQSYEQGWRKVPNRTLCQALFLLALKNRSAMTSAPCWKQTGCAKEVRDRCASYLVGKGKFCWVTGSQRCRTTRTRGGETKLACLKCPVLAGVLAA